jgi:hypothetical protein
VYRLLGSFCLFALCNPLKRQATGSLKIYAATQHDQISGHSLPQGSNSAQVKCNREAILAMMAYNFFIPEI